MSGPNGPAPTRPVHSDHDDLVETRLPGPSWPLGPFVGFVAGVRLSVRSKLLIAFLGGAVYLSLMGAAFLFILGQMNEQVDELGLLRLNMELAAQMEESLASQMPLRAEALLTGDDENNEKIANAKAVFLRDLDLLQTLGPQSPADRFDRLIEANDRLTDAGQRTLDLFERGEIRQAMELYLSEEHPVSHELEAETGLLIEAADREWVGVNAKIDSQRSLITRVVWWSSGIGFAAALFLALVMSWSFVRPVRQIGYVLRRVATGDFSLRVKVSNKDELGSLGDDANSMSQRLTNLYSGLEDANWSLEEKVRQGADALEKAYEELVMAQQQLTTSEKLAAIGQMSAGVAHDLRNPLAAIKNAAYIMGQAIDGGTDAVSSKLRSNLDIIEEEVSSSDKVINDLLSFTRVGTPVLAEARISDIIERALGTFVIRDNVTLVNRIDPELGMVMADEEQLQRVFLNLANNAQEAMPEGGELTVSGARRDGRLEVSFADTGGGVPAEDLDRIFDPLFTTKPDGTGLGLAVCQEIVDKHGGSINAANNAGPRGGATFVVTLPAISS